MATARKTIASWPGKSASTPQRIDLDRVETESLVLEELNAERQRIERDRKQTTPRPLPPFRYDQQ